MLGAQLDAWKDVAFVKRYTDFYLKRNPLAKYLNGIKGLDNNINLFFINYEKLNRSSYRCAKLWLAVMRARTQMTNAITHLNDQERYISKDYKDVRIKELQQFVAPCRIGVAKAIQYLVIFNKHNDEEWRFLRKGFLKKHAKSLAESLEESCNNWRDFIVEKYGVAEVTKEAYVRHLESQNKLATDALVETEAKSFKEKKNIQLEKEMGELLKNLKKVNNPTAIAEKDLYQLRVLMSAVEDIEEFKKLDDDDDDDDDDEEVVDEGNEIHALTKLIEIVKLRDYDQYNIDRAQVEKHLHRKEYKQAFGVSCKTFSELPAWKQKMLKQKAGLF